ncbi:MAG TPA: hypothetical protein VIX73_05070, partial [Kofleriaceae bacterium]
AVPRSSDAHPLMTARATVNAKTSWHLLALINIVPGWVLHVPLATRQGTYQRMRRCNVQQ